MELFFDETEPKAEFSPCRVWRYTLQRCWADGPCVAFLLFNPSTADESSDDPTIRKCRGFALRWGYGSMVIVNLFSIRGTDPKTVARVSDPVGPMNDYHILKALIPCEEVICAWGCGGHIRGDLAKRPAFVMNLIDEPQFGRRVVCLGYSADGSPRHPLMLRYDTPREKFVVRK